MEPLRETDIAHQIADVMEALAMKGIRRENIYLEGYRTALEMVTYEAQHTWSSVYIIQQARTIFNLASKLFDAKM